MFSLKAIIPSVGRPTARFGHLRRVSRSMPVEYFVLANTRFEGRVVGELAGKPIYERVVDGDGLQYCYAGLAPRDCHGRFDVESLQAGEWIVRPGLVYALDTEDAPELQG